MFKEQLNKAGATRFGSGWAWLVDAGGTSWTANASLFLKTGADVAPGSYSSTLTLSLFEDAIG